MRRAGLGAVASGDQHIEQLRLQAHPCVGVYRGVPQVVQLVRIGDQVAQLTSPLPVVAGGPCSTISL